ncbi:F0F1 ATP synthase subunit epsilon [Aldersonia sp. NBC_00410]|uniref:F0F1 ATP synthase subunit epsilon n=1 Tax=Aldersonia sp. NBC_00410 TaxID=2975954 RepID=UPI00225A44BB|nr:F0F1 ATP synthase subunit epsilon [Aldersonia sp. NBC_00410]MCX5043542.1 F0F1 ATP synthase subunit epsilon [Aldersonia sp. NBC_00410]
MAEMKVDLVAVERKIWSGEATFVFARTVEGEIGILPHHIPLMAELVADASVRIDTTDGEQLIYAVDGGFLSVTKEGVTILAEDAQAADEIDVDRATRDAESDDEKVSARGRARLRAVGRTV